MCGTAISSALSRRTCASVCRPLLLLPWRGRGGPRCWRPRGRPAAPNQRGRRHCRRRLLCSEPASLLPLWRRCDRRSGRRSRGRFRFRPEIGALEPAKGSRCSRGAGSRRRHGSRSAALNHESATNFVAEWRNWRLRNAPFSHSRPGAYSADSVAVSFRPQSSYEGRGFSSPGLGGRVFDGSGNVNRPVYCAPSVQHCRSLPLLRAS